MKRIIIHWSAGGYKPNKTDKTHYHFMVDDNGNVTKGIYKPEDNDNCKDGRYAQHTGKGNTGSIGISMCGMAGFDTVKKQTKYPLTQKQLEACFKTVADLCHKYNIPITPDTVLTHYEFNQRNNIKTGKIDIVYLPTLPTLRAYEIGAYIRNKVTWYYVRGGKNE